MSQDYRVELEKSHVDQEFSLWDQMVEESPEATAFSNSAFLKATGQKFRCYKVLKGSEIKAGFAVLLSADETCTIQDDFTIHSGLFFSKPAANANPSTEISNRFDISETVAQFLASEFKENFLALSPQITDLRPFLWVNYGEIDKPKFVSTPRFTSYLTLSGFLDSENPVETSAFKVLGYSRRQEVRYALQAHAKLIESQDIEPFIQLYRATFEKQNLDPKTLEARLERLTELLSTLNSAQKIEIFYVEGKEPRISNGAIYLKDSKRRYYLFGANDHQLQTRFSGTFVLWESLRTLAQRGCKEVDFEGINSPKRGWFKLSFGGNVTPYHWLRFGKG